MVRSLLAKGGNAKKRKEIINRREPNRSTKHRVINATVTSTLLYGCETWTLLERHKNKVQASEMRCLRRVEGVSILDKVRNEDIRSRLGQLAVVSRVEKKTEWLRKMEGMTDDRMVKGGVCGDSAGYTTKGKTKEKMG